MRLGFQRVFFFLFEVEDVERRRSYSLSSSFSFSSNATIAVAFSRGSLHSPLFSFRPEVPRADALLRSLPLKRKQQRALSKKKKKMPGESALPFVLISVMVAGMGSLQQGVHKLFNGKPKPVGVDAFDRAAAARDKKIREEAKVS